MDWPPDVCCEDVVASIGRAVVVVEVAAVAVEVARALPNRKSRHRERSNTRFERKKVAHPIGNEAAETRDM